MFVTSATYLYRISMALRPRCCRRLVLEVSVNNRMRVRTAIALVGGLAIAGAVCAAAQEQKSSAPQTDENADPKATEQWEPVPAIVTPGSADSAPPSDAIVLFDGKNLDQWVNTADKSPANWIVSNGVMTVSKAKGAGNIETKRAFHNYQLHIEWKIPANVTGTDQLRGNSGIFLA